MQNVSSCTGIPRTTSVSPKGFSGKRIKSRTEANIHRYILLAFMVITMLIGNYVLATILTPLFDK